MGHIISHIESIGHLRFVKLRTGRPAKIKQALDLGNGRVVAELENGSFTILGGHAAMNAPLGNWAVLGFGVSEPSKAVLDGLAKMGVITRVEVREHVARAKQRAQRQSEEHARKQLERHCKTLGITVPEIA